MLPGIAKMKNQLPPANLDDKLLQRQVAIIPVDDAKERRSPDVLKGEPQKRIAAARHESRGDQQAPQDHRNMADVMKMMGSGAKRGPARRPRQHDGLRRRHAEPEQMRRWPQRCRAACRPERPGAWSAGPAADDARTAPRFPGAPGGLPGLGRPGGLPGLGGFPGLGKKK